METIFKNYLQYLFTHPDALQLTIASMKVAGAIISLVAAVLSVAAFLGRFYIAKMQIAAAELVVDKYVEGERIRLEIAYVNYLAQLKPRRRTSRRRARPDYNTTPRRVVFLLRR